VAYVVIVKAMETKAVQAEETASKLLTYQDLARRIGCTVRHIQMLVRRRHIPSIKCGRLVRFRWESVIKALEEAQ